METHMGKLPRPNPRKIAGQKAADTRWGRTVERATHQGTLDIAGTELSCYVLEDGRRVISQSSIMNVMGRTPRGRRASHSNRPPFLEANNLTAFISPELQKAVEGIEYRVGDNSTVISGHDAEILPRVCNVYLDAAEAGVLTTTQKPIATSAQRIIKALALVGITALVDEATGYQETRAKDELQRLLEAYIAEEFRPWIRTFPETFFKEVYRLQGWEFVPGNNHHPQYVGKFINKYIYEAMPSGIVDRLRTLNPKNDQGNRPRKHHQHLTDDIGVNHLERQINQVITLMQASDDKVQFENLFTRVNSRNSPIQQILEF